MALESVGALHDCVRRMIDISDADTIASFLNEENRTIIYKGGGWTI